MGKPRQTKESEAKDRSIEKFALTTHGEKQIIVNHFTGFQFSRHSIICFSNLKNVIYQHRPPRMFTLKIGAFKGACGPRTGGKKWLDFYRDYSS